MILIFRPIGQIRVSEIVATPPQRSACFDCKESSGVCIGFTWCSAESRETHDLTAQIFQSNVRLSGYLTHGCKQPTLPPFYCSKGFINLSVKVIGLSVGRLGRFWI